MSKRNLAAYSGQDGSHGGSGYPLLRLVALAACSTRTIIDADAGLSFILGTRIPDEPYAHLAGQLATLARESLACGKVAARP